MRATGVRFGSADIYAAVDRIPEVSDSLVIGAELDGGRYWMPLFVTLREGAVLDDALRSRIATEIRRVGSARHVPDEIVLVHAGTSSSRRLSAACAWLSVAPTVPVLISSVSAICP